MVACCCLIAIGVATCRPVDELTEDPHPGFESLIDVYSDIEVAVAQGATGRAPKRFCCSAGGKTRPDRGRPPGPVLRRQRRRPLRADHRRGFVPGDNRPGSGQPVRGACARPVAESSDPVLLTAAAEYLLHGLRSGTSFSEDHVLAQDCLERAASLDPESVRTRTMLAAVVSGERRHAGWERVRDVAPVDQYDALAALPAVERFEAMAQAALDSLVSVRGPRRRTIATWPGTSR